MSTLLLSQGPAHGATNLTDARDAIATTPALSVVGTNGWIAWLEYDASTDATTLWARRLLSGAPSGAAIRVDAAAGKLLSPCVVTIDGDDAWFFWVDVGASGGTLLARQRRLGNWVADPISVSSAPAAHPSAVRDADGIPWVAWEASGGQRSRIVASHWTGMDFSPPTSISEAGVSSYEPALALDSRGRIWVAWQAYIDSNYEIVFSIREGGAWSAAVQATKPYDASNNYLGQHLSPALAVGVGGNMWIGWVTARASSRVDDFTSLYLYGLFQERRVQVRWVSEDGSLGARIRQAPIPLGDAPAGLFAPEIIADEAYRGPGPLRLVVQGGVNVIFRLPEPSCPPSEAWRCRPFEHQVWLQSFSSGTGWLQAPVNISGVDGRGYREAPAVAVGTHGVLIAWQEDASRRLSYGAANVALPYTSDIMLEQWTPAGARAVVDDSPDTFAAPLAVDGARREASVSHLGSTLKLYRGDVHAHSIYSNDVGLRHAGLSQTYRYLRDQAALDFAAITDHGHHHHAMDWHRASAHCGLHLGLGYLTPLLAHEYTSTTTGHLNVIYPQCEGKLFSREMSIEGQVWPALAGSGALTIPHHSADHTHTTNLNVFAGVVDDPYTRLFEVYQARRSFECEDCVGVNKKICYSNRLGREVPCVRPADPDNSDFAVGYFQDFLAKGHKMGAIASPDHGGYWGVAAVYAPSRSQADLSAALFARRTYGVSNASARLQLDFRADGHLMGEEYQLHEDCPIFYGRVSTDYVNPLTGESALVSELKLYRVDVGAKAPLEDGQVMKLEPGVADASFTFYDSRCPGAGQAAYYLRAQLSDVLLESEPTLAWSSPVFVSWAAGARSRDAALESHDVPTSVRVGDGVSVRITMTNTGDIPWSGLEGYRLAFTSGDALVGSSPALSANEFVMPGSSWSFEMRLDAVGPAGLQDVNWQMESPAGRFGEALPLSIEVNESIAPGADGAQLSDGGSAGADCGLCEEQAPRIGSGCSCRAVEARPWTALLVLLGLVLLRRRRQPTPRA